VGKPRAAAVQDHPNHHLRPQLPIVLVVVVVLVLDFRKFADEEEDEDEYEYEDEFLSPEPAASNPFDLLPFALASPADPLYDSAALVFPLRSAGRSRLEERGDRRGTRHGGRL